MIKILALLLCVKVWITLAELPKDFVPTDNYRDIKLIANHIWPYSEDERIHPCYVVLNTGVPDNEAEPKLFNYLNPDLFYEPEAPRTNHHKDFQAFRNAFYRTRSEIRNARAGMDRDQIHEKRKEIFEEFLDEIIGTSAFVKFRNAFENHPWFTDDSDNYQTLKDELTKLWVPLIENAGFDYNFMGNVGLKAKKEINAHYDGLHNWLGYYFNEQDNLVHTKLTEKIKRYQNVITGFDFTYLDVLNNNIYEANKNIPSVSAHQKTKSRSMMFGTPLAYEFFVYTAIALLNNRWHNTDDSKVLETVTDLDTDTKLIKKTAVIAVRGFDVKLVVNILKSDDIEFIRDAYLSHPIAKDIEEKGLGYYENNMRTCHENGYYVAPANNNNHNTGHNGGHNARSHIERNFTSLFDILF